MQRPIVRRLGMAVLAAASAIVLTACPPPDNPDPDPDDDEPNPTFQWLDPDAEESSSLSLTSYQVEEAMAAARFLVGDSGEGPLQITPDTFKLAFRYIALVPENAVKAIWNVGLQCYRLTTDRVRGEDAQLTRDDLIPGYNCSNDRYGDTPVFEAYLDGSTPQVTDVYVKDLSFPLFDGRGNGSLRVMDLYAGSDPVMTDSVPRDPSIKYTGVAYEIVYEEVGLAGYGLVRFYLNDDAPYSAGDVVVHKTEWEDGVWKWVYLRHGDGPDGDCLTRTSADPGYAAVMAPDDPENPSGSWSSHPYDGVYETYYTFLFDDGPMGFYAADPQNGNTNWTLRPSGTGSYSYWVAVNELMYTGMEAQMMGYTSPHIELDDNPGGFAYVPTGIWAGKADIYEAFGTATDRRVAGVSPVHTPERQCLAMRVYHEPDYHRGPEDLTQAVYLDAPLEAGWLLTRQELLDEFGRYAWDSGVYSRLYDDSAILYQTPDFSYVWINPLHYQLGRLCVYADAPHDSVSPSYSDPILDAIIGMNITFELQASLRAVSDAAGRAFGVGGAVIAASDFEKRFLAYVPTWELPTGPTAIPYSFNGTDDPVKPPITLTALPTHFRINHQYVRYHDVYSATPRLAPDPLDGPFADPVEVSLRAGHGSLPTRLYYTLDGSAPAFDAEGNPTGSTTEYAAPIPVPAAQTVTVTAVAVEELDDQTGETKEPSAPVVTVYRVAAAGYTLNASVPDSPAATGANFFVGLFGTASVDLSTMQNPLRWAVGKDSGAFASFTVDRIPAGTYYLCVLVDADGDNAPSLGDYVYPAQAGSPLDTGLLAGEAIDMAGNLARTLTGSWSEF